MGWGNYGGETGIRTLDTLRYTRFPSVRLQPLGHLSSAARGNFLTLPHAGREDSVVGMSWGSFTEGKSVRSTAAIGLSGSKL